MSTSDSNRTQHKSDLKSVEIFNGLRNDGEGGKEGNVLGAIYHFMSGRCEEGKNSSHSAIEEEQTIVNCPERDHKIEIKSFFQEEEEEEVEYEENTLYNSRYCEGGAGKGIKTGFN